MSDSTVAAPRWRTEPLQNARQRSARKFVPHLDETIANLALFIWLAGVLVFGRAFSEIGRSPFFLADGLAIAGTLLSIPRWWGQAIKPGIRGLLLIAAALAVLTAQSVYRGAMAGYPSALKSACMGVYPLVAVAIAGLIAREPQLIQRFAQRVLPVLPLGFLLVVFVGAPYIPASTGLYLAYAAAWAAVPGHARRTMIAIGTLIAASYLTDVGARRGPTIAIVVAVLATRLAVLRRLRTDRRGHPSIALILSCFCVALIMATTLVFLNSNTRMDLSDVPVVGPLASRVVASSRPGTESGNNIALRREMWRYALTTTVEENPLIGRGAGRPVVAGLGPTITVDRRSGVHNSFIGYAFYSGLPSAVLVVVAFLLALKGSWRYRALPYCAALFGAITAVAATCMTNIALETPYIAGPAWAVLGAAVGAAAAARGRNYAIDDLQTAIRPSPTKGARARATSRSMERSARAAET